LIVTEQHTEPYLKYKENIYCSLHRRSTFPRFITQSSQQEQPSTSQRNRLAAIT